MLENGEGNPKIATVAIGEGSRCRLGRVLRLNGSAAMLPKDLARMLTSIRMAFEPETFTGRQALFSEQALNEAMAGTSETSEEGLINALLKKPVAVDNSQRYYPAKVLELLIGRQLFTVAEIEAERPSLVIFYDHP